MTGSATVTVSVTQEHIDHGERMRCNRCPVALAIMDAIPDVSNANVDTLGWAALHYGGSHFAGMALPPEVTDFVLAFDARRPVSPFTFTAEVLA